MEEKILEIIKTKQHGRKVAYLDALDFEQTSKEITTHVFEFIDWVSHNTRISWEGYVFLQGRSFPPNWNSIDKLYEYWRDNIKNK